MNASVPPGKQPLTRFGWAIFTHRTLDGRFLPIGRSMGDFYPSDILTHRTFDGRCLPIGRSLGDFYKSTVGLVIFNLQAFVERFSTPGGAAIDALWIGVF